MVRRYALEKFLYLFTLLSFGLSLVYAVAYITLVPDFGARLADDGQAWVVSICADRCQALNLLQYGDRITRIDGLTYDEYAADRHLVSLVNPSTGRAVALTVLRNGQTLEIDWPVTPLGRPVQISRVLIVLFAALVWLGVAALVLRARPRNQMAVALFHLNALMVTAAAVSSVWHVAGTALFWRSVLWLVIPVTIHLLWTVHGPPESFSGRLAVLYLVGVALAVAEVAQWLPAHTYQVAIVLAFLACIAILWPRRSSAYTSPGPEARIMLLGMVTVAMPWATRLLLTSLGYWKADYVLTIALNLGMINWTLFYIYAIFRSHMGQAEPYAHQLLNAITVASIYLTLAGLLTSLSAEWLQWSANVLTINVLGSCVLLILSYPLARHIASAIEIYHLHQALQDQINRQQRVNETIIRQSKMAAIGKLASQLNHEINSPLQAIMASCETMAECPNADHRERIDRILKQIDYVSQLVRSTGQFVRPAADMPKEVDVLEVLRDTLTMASIRIKRAGVEVQAPGPDEKLPPVFISRSHLTQVLTALITNACEAMSANDGYLRMLAIATGTQNGHVVLRVCDTGPGIPKEQQEVIFEAFYTTKEEEVGTRPAHSQGHCRTVWRDLSDREYTRGRSDLRRVSPYFIREEKEEEDPWPF